MLDHRGRLKIDSFFEHHLIQKGLDETINLIYTCVENLSTTFLIIVIVCETFEETLEELYF